MEEEEKNQEEINKKELILENSENIINKRKQKIVDWLKKDNLNIALVAVLIFAIAIRLYYFFLVGNQPLWWDEAVYGSLAKNFISHQWTGTDLIIGETLIRPILFPVMWAGLLFLKIPESGIRFFLELVPSILSVFFVYLIGKEIFNKRIGIISAFLFSVLWIHLFYSIRLLTNVPSLVFLFSSIYLFILATKKIELNYKYFLISLILLSIATLIRYPNGIIFFVYLFMLILGKQLYLNKKKFWIIGIIGIAPILIFFLINFISFGNIFPALFGGEYINVSEGEKIINPIDFKLLKFIPIYLKTTFFIFFIVGLALLAFNLSVGFNFISKSRKLRNYLLILLILTAVFSFFIFYLRSAEDRWLFPISLPLSLLGGFGLDIAYKSIKKYNKYFAIIFLLIILIIGANAQLKFADSLIKNKQQSFLQIRQGFEWINENTPKEAIIIGKSIEPYVAYYAERNYILFPQNNSPSEIEVSDYLVFHSFAPQPEYINKYLQENQDIWTPVNALFFDMQKTQPAVVIFKNKDISSKNSL